jgi:hypothetical protein
MLLTLILRMRQNIRTVGTNSVDGSLVTFVNTAPAPPLAGLGPDCPPFPYDAPPEPAYP